MPVNVQLQMYEGPLDLLLHLIKKNELSITDIPIASVGIRMSSIESDIPIASITEQYLATLELMQSLNLDVSGEFLVMAATLVHIKSRMLLPPDDEEGDDEEEGEDPRAELTRRLLEYEQFKDAAKNLEERPLLYRDVFVRPNQEVTAAPEVSFERLSIFDLMSAFRRVLERFPGEAVHTVILETVSVRERMTFLLDQIHHQGRVQFDSLFDGSSSRLEVIVTFLAMLELIKMRAIAVTQEERLGPIVIEASLSSAELEERMTDELDREDDYGG